MPVFNEEQCIDGVLAEWLVELDRSGVDYELMLLDDGSTDQTPAILKQWSHQRGEGRIAIVSHSNRGHGQTCLKGYRAACERRVPWVLQIDSDGQCDPSFFAALWKRRIDHDVVYGCRVRRCDGWKRAAASALVRLVVKVAAGADCVDANVPYRLMRTARLDPLLDSIPQEFDLANIALAVQLARAGWREAAVPIAFRPRAGGEPSIPLSRFAVKAAELVHDLRRLPPPELGALEVA